MMVKRQGHLTTNGVILEKHEMMTVNFLLAKGKDIELIKPSSIPNSKNADFKMDQVEWEMKCPKGRGKYVVRDSIRRAMTQSANIVIDLRRLKSSKEKAKRDLKRLFEEYVEIKRLLVIDQELIVYKR